MNLIRLSPLAICLFVLTGCASREALSDYYLREFATPDPIPANFYECHGFGCATTTHVDLSDDEWRQVRAVFAPPPPDANAERLAIATAISLMQSLVGERSGTSAHQYTRINMRIVGNPDADETQLDCIDESVDTWTYLTMMAKDGLLRFHAVGPLAYAGGPLDFHPRNTAVLREEASGVYFAVDPTLVDATMPPPIFRLAAWSGHWPPDRAALAQTE